MNRIVTLVGAVLLAAPAFAEDAAPVVVADTDGNGTYSLDEVKAVYADLTAEAFAAIDTNADGALDADELKAAQDGGKLVLAK